jgi:excinuclease ABC subunit A
MPDVEVLCSTCKGSRFNQDTLNITYRDKGIADILEMSIEEGVIFLADVPAIGKKIQVMEELGLGYLTLGPSATARGHRDRRQQRSHHA